MSKLLGKEKNTVFLLFCKAWVALLEGSRFIDYQIADQVFAGFCILQIGLIGQFDVFGYIADGSVKCLRNLAQHRLKSAISSNLCKMFDVPHIYYLKCSILYCPCL